jgi:hypothetical protein
MDGHLKTYITDLHVSKHGKHYPTVTVEYADNKSLSYSVESDIKFGAAVMRYVNRILPDCEDQAAKFALTSILVEKFGRFFDARGEDYE